MANLRLLVNRRKAVRNIRKITRTMELIATARFKKAMDRAAAAEAYTRKIGEIAADLTGAGGDVPTRSWPSGPTSRRRCCSSSGRTAGWRRVQRVDPPGGHRRVRAN